MIKKYIFLILSIIWMIIIYCFSAQHAELSSASSMGITEYIVRLFAKNPSVEFLETIETLIRKLSHLTEYAILSLFVFEFFRSCGFSVKKSSLCILVSFIYAITDEIHQYFVPGRACRILDIIIDTSGAALSYLFIIFILFLKNYMGKGKIIHKQ